ncbi:MAG: hypothetical protein WAV12_27515, partial [Trebonia sp.]
MTPAASAAPDAGAARRTAEAVWRIESARLIAGLARLTGDVGRAEDLAQDALVEALEQWPATSFRVSATRASRDSTGWHAVKISRSTSSST